ncbi:MAG: DUF3638 domain-containing protein [Chlamydiales bacterium]|nr:DUF3638 domain-containing protein [Chlamydiales bacterium]
MFSCIYSEKDNKSYTFAQFKDEFTLFPYFDLAVKKNTYIEKSLSLIHRIYSWNVSDERYARIFGKAIKPLVIDYKPLMNELLDQIGLPPHTKIDPTLSLLKKVNRKKTISIATFSAIYAQMNLSNDVSHSTWLEYVQNLRDTHSPELLDTLKRAELWHNRLASIKSENTYNDDLKKLTQEMREAIVGLDAGQDLLIMSGCSNNISKFFIQIDLMNDLSDIGLDKRSVNEFKKGSFRPTIERLAERLETEFGERLSKVPFRMFLTKLVSGDRILPETIQKLKNYFSPGKELSNALDESLTNSKISSALRELAAHILRSGFKKGILDFYDENSPEYWKQVARLFDTVISSMRAHIPQFVQTAMDSLNISSTKQPVWYKIQKGQNGLYNLKIFMLRIGDQGEPLIEFKSLKPEMFSEELVTRWLSYYTQPLSNPEISYSAKHVKALHQKLLSGHKSKRSPSFSKDTMSQINVSNSFVPLLEEPLTDLELYHLRKQALIDFWYSDRDKNISTLLKSAQFLVRKALELKLEDEEKMALLSTLAEIEAAYQKAHPSLVHRATNSVVLPQTLFDALSSVLKKVGMTSRHADSLKGFLIPLFGPEIAPVIDHVFNELEIENLQPMAAAPPFEWGAKAVALQLLKFVLLNSMLIASLISAALFGDIKKSAKTIVTGLIINAVFKFLMKSWPLNKIPGLIGSYLASGIRQIIPDQVQSALGQLKHLDNQLLHRGILSFEIPRRPASSFVEIADSLAAELKYNPRANATRYALLHQSTPNTIDNLILSITQWGMPDEYCKTVQNPSTEIKKLQALSRKIQNNANGNYPSPIKLLVKIHIAAIMWKLAKLNPENHLDGFEMNGWELANFALHQQIESPLVAEYYFKLCSYFNLDPHHAYTREEIEELKNRSLFSHSMVIPDSTIWSGSYSHSLTDSSEEARYYRALLQCPNYQNKLKLHTSATDDGQSKYNLLAFRVFFDNELLNNSLKSHQNEILKDFSIEDREFILNKLRLFFSIEKNLENLELTKFTSQAKCEMQLSEEKQLKEEILQQPDSAEKKYLLKLNQELQKETKNLLNQAVVLQQNYQAQLEKLEKNPLGIKAFAELRRISKIKASNYWSKDARMLPKDVSIVRDEMLRIRHEFDGHRPLDAESPVEFTSKEKQNFLYRYFSLSNPETEFESNVSVANRPITCNPVSEDELIYSIKCNDQSFENKAKDVELQDYIAYSLGLRKVNLESLFSAGILIAALKSNREIVDLLAKKVTETLFNSPFDAKSYILGLKLKKFCVYCIPGSAEKFPDFEQELIDRKEYQELAKFYASFEGRTTAQDSLKPIIMTLFNSLDFQTALELIPLIKDRIDLPECKRARDEALNSLAKIMRIETSKEQAWSGSFPLYTNGQVHIDLLLGSKVQEIKMDADEISRALGIEVQVEGDHFKMQDGKPLYKISTPIESATSIEIWAEKQLKRSVEVIALSTNVYQVVDSDITICVEREQKGFDLLDLGTHAYVRESQLGCKYKMQIAFEGTSYTYTHQPDSPWVNNEKSEMLIVKDLKVVKKLTTKLVRDNTYRVTEEKQLIAETESAMIAPEKYLTLLGSLNWFSNEMKVMANEHHITKIMFPFLNLSFEVECVEGIYKARDHDHFPGFWIAEDQFDPALLQYPLYLKLVNSEGQVKVIIPGDDTIPSLATAALQSAIPKLLSPYLSSTIETYISDHIIFRRARLNYYVYTLDKKKSLTSLDPDSLAYLFYQQLCKGSIKQARQTLSKLESAAQLGPIHRELTRTAELIQLAFILTQDKNVRSLLLKLESIICENTCVFVEPDKACKPRYVSWIAAQLHYQNYLQDASDLDRYRLNEYHELFLLQGLVTTTSNFIEPIIKQLPELFQNLINRIGLDVFVQAKILMPSVAKRYRDLRKKHGEEIGFIEDYLTSSSQEQVAGKKNNNLQYLSLGLEKVIAFINHPFTFNKCDAPTMAITLVKSLEESNIEAFMDGGILKLLTDETSELPLTISEVTPLAIKRYFIAYYSLLMGKPPFTADTEQLKTFDAKRKQLLSILPFLDADYSPETTTLLAILNQIDGYQRLFPDPQKLLESYCKELCLCSANKHDPILMPIARSVFNSVAKTNLRKGYNSLLDHWKKNHKKSTDWNSFINLVCDPGLCIHPKLFHKNFAFYYALYINDINPQLSPEQRNAFEANRIRLMESLPNEMKLLDNIDYPPSTSDLFDCYFLHFNSKDEGLSLKDQISTIYTTARSTLFLDKTWSSLKSRLPNLLLNVAGHVANSYVRESDPLQSRKLQTVVRVAKFGYQIGRHLIKKAFKSEEKTEQPDFTHLDAATASLFASFDHQFFSALPSVDIIPDDNAFNYEEYPVEGSDAVKQTIMRLNKELKAFTPSKSARPYSGDIDQLKAQLLGMKSSYETLLKSSKKELLTAVNYRLASESDRVLELAQLKTNVSLTFEELAHQFISGDLKGTALEKAFFYHWIAQTHLQHLNRLLSCINQPLVLTKELRKQRAYTFDSVPLEILRSLIAFEVSISTLVWEKPTALLIRVLESQDKHLVMESVVGSGKTFFGVPTSNSVISGKGHHISINLFPRNIANSNIRTISQQTRSIHKEPASTFTFTRHTPYTKRLLWAFYMILKRVQHSGGSVNMTDRDAQNFELSFLLALKKYAEGADENAKSAEEGEKLVYFARCLQMMRSLGFAMIDEIHEISKETVELCYPLGHSKSLADYPEDVNMIVQAALILHRANGSFDVNHLATELLVPLSLDAKLWGEAHDYVCGRATIYPDWLDENPLKEKINLIKGICTKLMPIIRDRILQVHYGVASKSEVAVQYEGNETPAKNSTIKNPHEALIKTTWMRLQSGLTQQQAVRLLKTLEKAARVNPQIWNTTENGRWCKAYYPNYCFYNLSAKDHRQLTIAFRNDPEAIALYTQINSNQIKFFDRLAVSNSMDCISMFDKTRGLTGTAHPKKGLYYPQTKIYDLPGTLGELLQKIQKSCPKAQGLYPLDSLNYGKPMLDDLLKIVNSVEGCTAIYDKGALLRGLNAKVVARYCLKHLPEKFKGVAYYDEEGNAWMLKRQEVQPYPLSESTLLPNERFSYLGERQCFGADIPQPANSTGLVTIDHKQATTLEGGVVQAVGRMLRGADRDDKRVIFAYPKDMPIKVSHDLTHIAAENETNEALPSNYIADGKKIYSMRRRAILDRILSHRESPKMMAYAFEKHLDILMPQFTVNPSKLYGGTEMQVDPYVQIKNLKDKLLETISDSNIRKCVQEAIEPIGEGALYPESVTCNNKRDSFILIPEQECEVEVDQENETENETEQESQRSIDTPNRTFSSDFTPFDRIDWNPDFDLGTPLSSWISSIEKEAVLKPPCGCPIFPLQEAFKMHPDFAKFAGMLPENTLLCSNNFLPVINPSKLIERETSSRSYFESLSETVSSVSLFDIIPSFMRRGPRSIDIFADRKKPVLHALVIMQNNQPTLILGDMHDHIYWKNKLRNPHALPANTKIFTYHLHTRVISEHGISELTTASIHQNSKFIELEAIAQFFAGQTEWQNIELNESISKWIEKHGSYKSIELFQMLRETRDDPNYFGTDIDEIFIEIQQKERRKQLARSAKV